MNRKIPSLATFTQEELKQVRQNVAAASDSNREEIGGRFESALNDLFDFLSGENSQGRALTAEEIRALDLPEWLIRSIFEGRDPTHIHCTWPDKFDELQKMIWSIPGRTEV